MLAGFTEETGKRAYRELGTWSRSLKARTPFEVSLDLPLRRRRRRSGDISRVADGFGGVL
jgi:hypothetical protein